MYKKTWVDRALVTIVRGYPGGRPNGLFPVTSRLRPDLLTKVGLYLYEIKSVRTGANFAAAKALGYVTDLRHACVPAKVGPSGGPGTSGEMVYNRKLLVWSSTQAGAITYMYLPLPRRQPNPNPNPQPAPPVEWGPLFPLFPFPGWPGVPEGPPSSPVRVPWRPPEIPIPA